MKTAALVLTLAALTCADGVARPARLPARRCEPLRLTPGHARLSELMRQLSVVRNFQLEVWTAEDPVVSQTGGNDMEVMSTLAGQVNILARYAADKSCPGKWKLKTVWILPGKALAVPAEASATPVGLPPEPAQTASQAAGLDLYLRAHEAAGAGTAAATPGAALE